MHTQVFSDPAVFELWKADTPRSVGNFEAAVALGTLAAFGLTPGGVSGGRTPIFLTVSRWSYLSGASSGGGDAALPQASRCTACLDV